MPSQFSPCDLQKCFLCSRCLPEWRPLIALEKENRQLAKGETLFREGDPVEGIYFVFSGKFKVQKRWGQDKTLLIRFAGEGDLLGFRGMGKDKHYPISATALEPSLACYVRSDFFESCLRINHALTYDLMKYFATELQDAEKRMRNLVHMDLRGRVADTLLQLEQQFGKDANGFIQVNLTKQDLSAYAGTTYESFSRVISQFLEAGWIKVSGKKTSILQAGKLRQLLSEK